MRVCASIALLAALVSTASAAQFKPGETGTRFTPLVRHTPPKNAREVATEFGDCVVKRHRAQVIQYLDATTREERTKLESQVFDPDCLTKETEARSASELTLTLPQQIAKFALAEPLAREAIEAIDPTTLIRAPRLNYIPPDPTEFAQPKKPLTAKQSADIEKATQEATVNLAFEVYGECVVRQNPFVSKKLLTTATSSVAESNAFGSLMPAFSECLPKNQQFTATKAMLRGTIALAYYRLARAAQAQQQAAK